jgi:RNA polymerase sigma-70 factor (ECF subfamily)
MDFERLFEEHAPRLIELAATVVRRRSDAEDVVQEAFIKAYRARDGFRGEASPGTWLRRIVVNEAIDFERRIRRPGSTRGAGLDLAEGAPADGPAPDASASATERAEAVRRAIDQLPDEQRTVVLLRELEGMGYREIAELLGIPLGTVESRVMRARERLRVTLRKHLVEDSREELR